MAMMRLDYGVPIGVNAELPYEPQLDEILYVDGKHTVKIERWRIEYYGDIINESLSNPREYAEGYFALIVKLLNEPSFWEGFSEEFRQAMKTEIIDSFSFVDYVSSRKEIAPSLFVLHSRLEDGRYRFQQFVIGDKGITETLREVFAYMDSKDRAYAEEYEKHSRFPSERDEIIKQMQNCARQLLETGMYPKDIMDNLFISRPPRHLVVSSNGDILLLLNNGPKIDLCKQINLPPLDKAVYLLFLSHPEGINFSYLPDYREELMEIYRKLMKYRTTASMRKSVEDVTDPTKNSINEKCARIRRVFIDALGNHLASLYYITGNRGEAKKIVLDRFYVRWEGEENKGENVEPKAN